MIWMVFWLADKPVSRNAKPKRALMFLKNKSVLFFISQLLLKLKILVEGQKFASFKVQKISYLSATRPTGGSKEHV
jgi:hypothetical protein